LHTTLEVTDARVSRSKPDRGILRFKIDMAVDAAPVASFVCTSFLRRRPAS